MKKFLVLFLSFIIFLSIVGCGTKEENRGDSKNTVQTKKTSDETLMALDKNISDYLKEKNIDGKVVTEMTKHGYTTFISLKNNEDYKGNPNPEIDYLMSVWKNVLTIFPSYSGTIRGNEDFLKGVRPSTLILETASEKFGIISTVISVDELTKLGEKELKNKDYSVALRKLVSMKGDTTKLNEVIKMFIED